jgi:RNA polymerase sigma-70 factor (ECF subfamily)
MLFNAGFVEFERGIGRAKPSGPMQDASDDELMRRAGAGDRAAFAGLVERHFARAAGLAARIARNRSDAEEIVQEAFLRAWVKAPAWRTLDERADGARFATWLYRVVVNLSIDRARRPATTAIDEAAEVADPAPSADQTVARAETSRRVSDAIARLPERQRAALALCHYEGMSNIDAAAALDISVGALESLLVRARRALRAELADLAPPVTAKAAT